MALDPSGLTESCDRCNALITNWGWMGMAFLTFDGKVICNNCRGDLLKIDIERKSKILKESVDKQRIVWYIASMLKSYKVLICGVEKGRVSARDEYHARRKAEKMFPDFVGHIAVIVALDPYFSSQRSPFGIWVLNKEKHCWRTFDSLLLLKAAQSAERTIFVHAKHMDLNMLNWLLL